MLTVKIIALVLYCVSSGLIFGSDENKLDKSLLYLKNQEFLLGCSLPKKLSLEKVGTAIENGFNLVFSKVNSGGGINKKIKITFDVKDDQYNRELTKKNIAELQKKTSIFTGFLGADSIQSISQLLKNKNIALLFPFDSTFEKRELLGERICFFRPTLDLEIESLITYAAQQGVGTISIFYEDSLFGTAGLAVAEKIIKENNLKLITKVSYPKNTVNIMKAVKDIIKEQSPKAILCISHIYPTYNFIEQLVNSGLTNCLFLGFGELFEIQSVISKDRGKMVLSSVVPSPEKSNIDIVREYRAEMQKQRPLDDLSPLSLEGFICAKLMISLLERLDSNPTVSDLFTQINALDESFGGIKLKNKKSSLSQSVWLNEVGLEKDWIEYVGKKEEVAAGDKIIKNDKNIEEEKVNLLVDNVSEEVVTTENNLIKEHKI